jgi:hypothetical protein
MTMSELREARKLTLFRMAKPLGITQSLNSPPVAEFPERPPVVLSGIAEKDPNPKSAARKQRPAHA